ncbi:hypothetical protein [Paenibacillus sp. GYB003]|uniref:hypothetical protein n=1 Tax=Paenibacillus sp. GYB003 TaxID=2994392 RepID=UPI002F96DE3D
MVSTKQPGNRFHFTLAKCLVAAAAALVIPMFAAQSPKAEEEAIAFVDESADFSRVFSKTSNIAVSNSSPERYGGDASRFYKTTGAEAYLVYEAPDPNVYRIGGFDVETWYNKNGSGVTPGDMSFEVSPDNVVYTPFTGFTKLVSDAPLVGGWGKVNWKASSVPAGTKYVKIIFGDTSLHPSSWAIQIGKTTLYALDNSRQSLQELIAASQALLDGAASGENPGQYPPSAVASFGEAIRSARAVADDPASDRTALQAAYRDLSEARASFENAVIVALNWSESAAIEKTSSSLHHIAIAWPSVVEANRYANVVYHVYKNGAEAAAVTGTTYTFAGLKPQTEYEFSVVASAGSLRSRALGPAVLATDDVGPVPAPDFSLIDADDFADEDYIAPQVWVNDNRGIPYYFAHFHKVANAVRLDEPHRGFIDIVVHRNPKDNGPYNARVQENHLWLAYFYTRQASWNLYYGMPEVKYRLEAVLEHLLTLQSPEGAFSEYGWQQYNLPGTSFAVQFLGQTMRLLNEAKAANPDFPSIDAELYDRVVEAIGKAIRHTLNDPSFWNQGTSFTNQYTLMWSATAAYLAYHPDTAIEAKMRERFTQSADAFLSPAGFYYENAGFDMGYNLGVHAQNMMADYYYFKDTDLEAEWIAKESKFIEWLSYNLVLEPDGSHFTSNAAASGRTASSHIERKDFPFAEKLPLARAFVKTREEVAAEIARAKADIVKNGVWPNVPALSLNGENSYNPYALYNRILYRYYPSESEKAAAVRLLPYIASDRFNHQRNDDRSGLQFTYVRRPDYYAAFNAGPRKASQQSFGLGLLWHPEGGIMLSSQTEHTTAALSRGLSWGTRKTTNVRVYESGNMAPTYKVNGQPIQPAVGHGDLPQGNMKIRYDLGTAGDKNVVFVEKGVSVDVRHEEEFEENVPLTIAPGDIVTVNPGIVTVTRGNAVLEIVFDADAEAAMEPMGFKIYDYRIHMLKLKTSGELHYTITMKTLKSGAE